MSDITSNQSTLDKLFDSFCLKGKITEKHAEEIKEILKDELGKVYEKGKEEGIDVGWDMYKNEEECELLSTDTFL